MIKVFSPTDRSFLTNGDKIIKPTRAVVHKTDNGDFYLELTCGLEYIDYVKPNNIIVVPTPQGEQGFRVVAPVEATGSKIKVKAWHLFYDSQNYLIADSYVVNKTADAALDHLNAATDNPSPFTTYSDVMHIDSFRCVRKSLAEAIFTVLERWGGHIVRDNFNISIRNVIGQDNGVTIQYKKNLKNISVKENWSNVCTKCLPVGKDGYLLDELYLYSTTQYAIPYTKTVSFSQDIDEDDYPDEESYRSALRADLVAQCNEYLKTAQYPEITYSLKANVEKITDVGDIVAVYDERLGVSITAEVVSFEYDCILGQYTQVDFGTIGASLSKLRSNIKTSVDKAIEDNNQEITINLQAAIKEAEAQIWATLGSSYVVYSGDSILVLDRLPAEDAVNVMKIDEEGVSFSSGGINGTFVKAWSIDGTLNAQAFTISNFTADIIRGGTYKVGGNLNRYGVIKVYDQSDNNIAQFDKDGLKVYAKDGSRLVINPDIGLKVLDRLGNAIFWINEDEIHYKKSFIEEEVTLFNKLRYLPIEVYNNGTLVNDGIGLVSVSN